MSTLPINFASLQTPAFKGKTVQNENGVPYYKSNEGLKTGAFLSLLAGGNFLSGLRYRNPDNIKKEIGAYKKLIEDDRKNVDSILGEMNISNERREFYNKIFNKTEKVFENYEERLKRRAKIAIPAALAAIACTLGVGALIDRVRNKKAEQSANKMANAQSYDELMQNKDLKFDETGTIYHHSKTGKILGILLGAGCGIVNYLLSTGTLKKIRMSNVGIFGLGGLIVGSIYDGNVNKKSKNVSRNISQIA